MQAVNMLGNAAIPMMMILLGSHLGKGPAWESVKPSAIACVTAGKLLVQPCVALVLVAGLVYSGVLVAPPMLLLVILMQAVHLEPSPGSNTPAP